MEFLYTFNWWALLVALVWNVALGMFWYSPKVFFNIWQKAEGISDEALKANSPATAMLKNLIAAIVNVWAIGVLVNLTHVQGALAGAGLGALLALGLIVTTAFSNGAFRGTKTVALLIDGGYRLLFTTGAAALIAAWR